jgi:glycosyltransferase involved in cell wall biosynthesis
LVVLCACDLRSSAERKNIDGNILAFRTAFGNADGVTLIVKLSGGETYPKLARYIKTKIAALNNVRTVSAVLSPQRMANLIATADIILSLHRSEGFGLLPAQAMLMEKPTIATYWSGNMDYMAAEASIRVPPTRLVPVHDPQGIYPHPSMRWAEPDLDLAVAALRRLADDPGERRRVGKAAAVAIREHCSPERYWQTVSPDFQRLCTPGAHTGA